MAFEIVPLVFALCIVAFVVYFARNINGSKFIQIRKSFAPKPLPTFPKSKEDGPNKDRKWGGKLPTLYMSGSQLTHSVDSGRLRTTLASTVSKLVSRVHQTTAISSVPLWAKVQCYNGHPFYELGTVDRVGQ